MKLFFTLAVTLLLSLNTLAQGPLRFNYQAVIRNPNGALITNRQVAVRISILQGSATGTAVYVETHAPTTNANGLLTLDIGGGTRVSGNFANLTWSQGSFFLKTETDPAGGTNYSISNTSQLLSVPYALYAQSAGSSGHYIGELFGGGIIFYLWRDNSGVEHGLVASLDDLGTTVAWANPELPANVSPSHKDGASNTAAIITARPSGNAAAVCSAYAKDGFSDWYLPAVWELELLYTNALAVSSVLDGDGNSATKGLSSAAYWSSTSTERYIGPNEPTQRAYLKVFQDTEDISGYTSELSTESQKTGWAVRAIRRF